MKSNRKNTNKTNSSPLSAPRPQKTGNLDTWDIYISADIASYLIHEDVMTT